MAHDVLNTCYSRYFRLGWSVIPIAAKTKYPIISWRLAQKRRYTMENALEWARRWPNSGIGVVTGGLSGIFVVDVDSAEALESPFIKALPPTAMAKTSKGVHYYFKVPTGATIPTKVKFLPGIDCRGEGGYAVVPPSEHESGVRYEWITQPEDGIADIPPASLAVIMGRTATLESVTAWGETKWHTHLAGVTEGGRNDAAASLIGKLLADSPVDLWEAMCWKYIAEQWNFQNNPPLPTEELRRTFDSIAKKEGLKRASKTGAAIGPLILLEDVVLEQREPAFVIKGLLNEGLTLLLGKPKKGKSTLAQQIALDVAGGSEFLFSGDFDALGRERRFPVVEGVVLHLALEDDPQSYKRRALNLLEGRAFPDKIRLVCDWPEMFAGGLERLDEQLTNNPQIVLVIIDTAARFVGGKSPKVNNAFAADYEVFRPLHDLAIKHHKPIMLLVHSRKDSVMKSSGDSDPMDDVAGTLGGVAAADNFIALRRYGFDSPYGEISVTGRFIKSFRQTFVQKDWRFHAASASEIAAYLESKKPQKKVKDAA